MPSTAPLFSIGVTSYDRLELLWETVASVLAQDFGDFELLIGNDNPSRRLDTLAVGASDRRVRIINRPANLGEIGNMNALLNEARGQYFSWLADDDLYAPELLGVVAGTIEKFHAPACVFAAYSIAPLPPSQGGADAAQGAQGVRLEPAEFLRRYLERRLPILGCYGFFERSGLSSMGGMTPLSPGLSPYSDNLLAIRAALLRPVVIERPLIYFRTHEQSLSFTSVDVWAYRIAQESLWKHFTTEVLPRVNVSDADRDGLREALMRWCVKDFLGVVGRSGQWNGRELAAYAAFVWTSVHEGGRCQSEMRSKVTSTAAWELLKLPPRLLMQKFRAQRAK